LTITSRRLPRGSLTVLLKPSHETSIRSHFRDNSSTSALLHGTPDIKARVTATTTFIYHGVSCTQWRPVLRADLSLIRFTPHPRHYRKDSLHGNSQLSSSRISLLASELLYEIFSSLASRGLFQLRHALFVCKRWHDVIASNKKLWSTIVIDEETMDRFKLRDHRPEISRARAYIRACLERSAPLPIDVTIGAPFLDRFGPGCSMILGELFKSGKPRHIQRCRSLSWCIGYNHKDVPLVATLLPKSFERLEYLFLRDICIEGETPIRFPQCPRLKELHLFNYFDGFDYFLKRDHPYVEKLTYTAEGWAHYDIPYIQNFRRIRTLVLEQATHGSSSHFAPEDTSVAHLHYLETLKLIGSIPLEIMQRIRAPILRRVDIATGNSAPQSHVLDTIPLVLLQSVTEIGISICPSDPETPPDPHHLRRVICGAPSLTSIFATSEIGELLAGEGWFSERGIVYHCITRDLLDLPPREEDLQEANLDYLKNMTDPLQHMMVGPLQFLFDSLV
jgi:hypothetical protein